MGRRTDPRVQRLKGCIAVFGLRALARLPLPIAYGLAAALGGVGSLLPLSPRRVTRTNLALCFPELSPRELRRLTRRSLVEDARMGVDVARAWDRPEASLARLREVVGEREALERTVAEGRAVVILAPHIGCWELVNYWFSRHFPFHAMFMPSPLPPVDDLILEGRQRFGTTMHPATPRGVAGLVRALRGGAMTGILPDQVPARDAGRFVPFFGQPAWTGTLACKLIRQSEARGFMVFCRRRPDRGFELILRDPDPGIYDADLDAALAALNRSIESLIREDPAQYLWSYKRFRRRPDGAPKVYS